MRIFILLSFVLVFGCTDPKIVAELNLADELIAAHPDSAYTILKKIDPKEINDKANNALYALLYTQAQYKNYDSIKSDSLIDIAVDYYSNRPIKDRLTRAYMYKAGALSDMNRYKEAIEWYKMAEQVADTSEYLTLGLLNSHMGVLYQKTFIANNEHINKYKKAIKYARLLNNKNIEMSSLIRIGQLYIMDNKDSAHYYINQSLQLAKLTKDSIYIFKNLELLAKNYQFHGSYDKAKDIFLNVIKNRTPNFDYKSSIFNLSIIYARKGQIDSTNYYFNQIKSIKKASDSMRYYMVLEEIATATNDYRAAYKYYKLSNRISDSIILAGRKSELYAAEKQFDKKQIESKALKLMMSIKSMNYLIIGTLLILATFIYLTIIISKRKKRIFIDKITLIDQLQTEIANQEINIKKTLDNQMETISSLQESLSEQEKIETTLKKILEDRIKITRKLMSIKHEYSSQPSIFINHFNKIISINKKSQEEVDAIIKIANQLNNNVIERIKKSAPHLTSDDLLFLSLECLQFSNNEITVFIGNPSLDATNSARYRLKKKLNCSSITDYIFNVQNQPN